MKSNAPFPLPVLNQTNMGMYTVERGYYVAKTLDVLAMGCYRKK